MSAATTSKAPPPPSVPKCVYCNGTGRWTKDIIEKSPQESVYCPHCHGSGLGGADSSTGCSE